MDQSGPVERFLNLPELIERLVSFLDARSTLCLLRSRVMDKETREKSFSSKAWNQLIRRTPRMVGGMWEDGMLQKEGVRDLVKILKLMQLEEPHTFMLPLLDQICESSPDVPDEHIAIRCRCHTEPHIVSWGAFLLLEEVEGAFGTAEQSIQSVFKVSVAPDGLLRAITSRMLRQRETVTSFNDVYIAIRNADDVQEFATVMKAEEVSLRSIEISTEGKLGEEAWEKLAAAVRSNPNVVMRNTCMGREELAEERRESIMGIWDATTTSFLVELDEPFLSVDKSEYDRDGAWKRLLQISKMTQEEFEAESRKENGEDSESEGEDDGEEEGEDDGEEEGAEEEDED